MFAHIFYLSMHVVENVLTPIVHIFLGATKTQEVQFFVTGLIDFGFTGLLCCNWKQFIVAMGMDIQALSSFET